MESLVQANKHGLVQERTRVPSGYTLNLTDFNTERGQYPLLLPEARNKQSRNSIELKPPKNHKHRQHHLR